MPQGMEILILILILAAPPRCPSGSQMSLAWWRRRAARTRRAARQGPWPARAPRPAAPSRLSFTPSSSALQSGRPFCGPPACGYALKGGQGPRCRLGCGSRQTWGLGSRCGISTSLCGTPCGSPHCRRRGRCAAAGRRGELSSPRPTSRPPAWHADLKAVASADWRRATSDVRRMPGAGVAGTGRVGDGRSTPQQSALQAT